MLNEDRGPSHSQPIEILLVDDHPLVRRLLRQIIESHKNLRVVGEAVNGEEAVLLAARLKPAVVIMDIHLPILSGIAASTLIKVNNPFITIIALTAGPCQDEKAMTIAGAAAVINKDDVLHALRPAILNAVKRVKHPV
jgi:two-component system, NarL family, nitrate/nitrite response regulator NarL